MLKERKSIRINDNSLFQYFIYYPKSVKENLPVLLFLHGIGERGNNLDNIEKYALPKYMNKLDIPYIVIAPQCHVYNFWDYHLRDIEEIINSLKDIETEIQVAAERGFLDGINGSCHIPIGAYCDVDGENISLTGLYGDEDGNNLITKTINGKASEAREIGLQLAKLISKEYECYEG